jgi:asparagine synthase (glutamine-hydrolysing)
MAGLHPQAAVRGRFKPRFEALSAKPLALRLARIAGFNPTAEIATVLKGPFGQQVLKSNPLTSFEHAAELFTDRDRLGQVLMTDLLTILPHTFLEKVDKISMWHGIEARVPFLDNALVDYMSGLPSRYKIKGGVTKTMLRDIAADFLPSEVVAGRKQSFGTPMDAWLKSLLHDYAQGVFRAASRRWGAYFEFERISALHEEHAAGKANHSAILWRLVVLLVWLNHYGDKISMPPTTDLSGQNHQRH